MVGTRKGASPWPLGLAVFLLTVAGAQAQSLNFGAEPVGSAQGNTNVTVTARTAGTVATVEVLTAGTTGLDFATGSGSSCGTPTLAVNGTCTQSVTFTPAAPGIRIGAVVLLDSGNNVLGRTYIYGTGQGGLGVLVPGNVLTVAGDGNYTGSVGDGNQSTQASLYTPKSVTMDGAGNLYIADSGHNRIRKIAATTGIISTIAGNGNPAYTGDNGAATSATLNNPSGVALDGAGNLYIADTGNNVVRMIAASSKIMTTVAGNGTLGSTGSGIAATSAELNQPQGVTVDVSGNLYIADTSNHLIREVSASTGFINPVAGNGHMNSDGSGGYSGNGGAATSAELNFPYAVAFDAAGNIYIPDSANNVVREVAASTGTITTYAGTGTAGETGDGGASTSATLSSPTGVIADAARNVYIASGGSTVAGSIRKVSSATGTISTIAKNGSGEDLYNGAFNTISIVGPIGLYWNGSGNLYLADSLNMLVQEIQGSFVALDFTGTSVREGERSSVRLQTIENDGNLSLDVTGITLGLNAAYDSSTTTCYLALTVLTVDEDCEVGAEFAPSTSVTLSGLTQELSGNIDVVDNAVNTPLDIEVIGTATLVNATTTTLTSSLNPSGYGQLVSFTATVTTGANTGSLTGTVTFYDGSVALVSTASCANSVTLNGEHTAVCSTIGLSVGTHSITATYNNDSSHYTSTSSPLTQTVLEGTATTVVPSLNPSGVGDPVTFTITVTSSGGSVVPDGSVVLYDGSTILTTQTLNAGVVPTFTTSALADGLHSITAVYGGDSGNQIQGSTSTVLKQEVLVAGAVTLASSSNPSTYGLAVVFTAAVASLGTVPATGTVKVLDGGAQIGTITVAGGTGTFTISTLAVGSHTITASYGGDTNYASATAALTGNPQVVNQTQTSTVVVSVPTTGIAGGATALVASVKTTLGVNTPAGNVTFTSGGVPLGSAALGSAGTATLNSTFAVGSYSIVAIYAGDTDDGGSTSAAYSLTEVLATTATAVTASPSPAIVDSAVTFTAKVTGNGGTPGGTVTFYADGTSVGTATLDSTATATLSYSLLAAATHTIYATYSGDANDSSDISPTISLVVGKIPTATALGASSTGGANSEVTLVAVVVGSSGPTPSGTVTFTSGTTVLGSASLNSTGVAILVPNLATGTYSIVAAYGGDAVHLTSTSQSTTVSGTPIDFNLTVTPSSVTMATSQNATVTVTLTSISSYADSNIGMGCASLPSAVTCHFASASVSLAANGTQTDQLTIDTNDPLSGGSSAMNAHAGRRGASLAGLSILSLPLSVYFAWILRRSRKRNRAVFTMALVLLLSSAAMLVNGCSGFSQIDATPGTYVIQVTATGTNSDVVHYANVTLNITQ